MSGTAALLDRAAAGHALAPDDATALADCDDLPALMQVAAALRDQGHGARVSYSRKVFIPLTQLCRDVCHYCTFAHPPRRDARRLSDARRGARHRARRRRRPAATRRCSPSATSRSCATARRATALARLGHDSTISYLAAMARAGAAARPACCRTSIPA